MGHRGRGRIRRGAVLLAWLLVMGVVPGTAVHLGAAPDGPPDWVEELADGGTEAPDPVPWEGSTTQALPRVASEELPAPDEPRLPEPGSWDVVLGGEGETAEPTSASEDRAGPVEVATTGDGFDGDRLSIEVVDEDVAERAGVSGFVFGVSGFDGVEGDDDDGEGRALPVELSTDYSGFADAFGGGYAGRLRVVALPDCVLADPLPDGCPTAGVPVPTRNDREHDELVAEVDDLAGLATEGVRVGTPLGPAGDTGDRADAADTDTDTDFAAAGTSGALFAVTAGVTSEEGTWAATPLSTAGKWQVGTGSGEFSYGYDFDIPAPAGGSAPPLSMAYSSGAIDGLTTSSNTQAPPTGLGWSQFGGFIERRYDPCVKSLHTEDLCWLSQNGTISLDGVSGPLIPTDAANTQWKVASDAGWKVERLTGADNGEGGVAGADGVGEHWKVTATDGTQYFFGLGRNPDTGEATNSVGRVPVLADGSADPCWGNRPGAPNEWGMCDNQGYRWNLDRVVDPDGNVTTYVYDRGTNRYSAVTGLFNGRVYDRSTELARIDYGAHTGPATADRQPATARVTFARPYRCVTLATEDDPDPCPMPTGGNGLAFPDIPNDLICLDSTCSAHAPSFFVTGRYASLETSVLVGSAWKAVTRWNLFHSFRRGPIPDTPQKLYLDEIQQVGVSDPSLPFGFPLPSTRFDFTWLANRVDVDEAAGRMPMHHARVSQVINELGGRIDITYGQNRPCPNPYEPDPWHTNHRDCFPQITQDLGTRRTAVFNKYLVTQVTESAGALTTPMTTSYTYQDDPAWTFNYGSFAQYEDEWGWADWRGYETTLVTQGTSRTRTRVFRGLQGDPLWVERAAGVFCACGRLDWSVHSITDPSRSFVDEPALAGRVLEEVSLGTVNGTPNTMLRSTLNEYLRRVILDRPVGQLDVEWAGLAAVTDSVATAPDQYRQQRTTTTYNESHLPVPQAVSSLEEGTLGVTGDERCTRTTYADNPTRWMFEYPASNTVVAGSCSSNQVVSASETYYDGDTSATPGGAPTRGNATRERTRLTGSTWATTTTEYDALGRPFRVTDPNGARTTTTYTAAPANAIPTETRVTNHLGHAATTEWLPEYQVPRREVDANNNVTTYKYDGLGRLTKVALPTEQQSGMLEFFPSWQFSYVIDQGVGRSTVRSRQMTSFTPAPDGGTTTYEDTWVIYDGLGREWQSQQQSPESGKVLVSGTAYDGRGLAVEQFAPQAFAGTPGSLVVSSSWDNRTRSSYDELGRPTREEALRGTQVARTTETAYTADTVTVTGPDGDRTRETLDGLGRTTAVAEHDGQNWVTSSYEYDMADNLRTIVDPAGNRTEYTYDLAGRRLTQDDPDRGTATFTYDAAGNATSVVDAGGNALHTLYDALGRPTERHSGSPTGPLLAKWEYDTLQRGLLDRTTTVTSAGNWISTVTGYDQRGRAQGTRTTVPAGLPGLSGDYTVTQTYDRSDRVTSTTYPAIGGLPQESVTTGYDALGLATGLSSPLAPYVRTTTYDNRGRLTGAALGPAASGGGAWMAKSWSYDTDQQLSATQTFVAGSGQPDGVVARHELTYDDNGNLAERATRLGGQNTRECFDHDTRQRLTRAYTVALTATCAGGQVGTGAQPYEHRFAYAADGRLQTRSEKINPTLADLTLYGYPASGGDRPHAPTSLTTAAGTDTYTWDANGNLSQRVVAGRAETFTWDVQQRLASVQGPDGTTSFVYDADGQRVLRRTPTGSTLYLAGHEITTNTSGTVVNAARPYTFEGQLIATRTLTGLTYLATDEAGSVELAASSGGQPDATRAYEPYGQVRSSTGNLPTDRGFIGQVQDSTTSLSYLQNRYYDTTTGVFLSADPLYDTGKVKSLNPYTYGGANPTTLSDPNGLSPTYIHGLEVQNKALKTQNGQLRSHIRRLGSHIEDLQGIIRKQNRFINKLVTRINAMERIIDQQQRTIRKLVNRVNYLVGVVNYQRAVIGRLQAKIAYQQRVIAWQAGVIAYQRGVIYQLVGIAFMPAYQAGVLASINAGRGVPGIEGSWMLHSINQAAIIQSQAGTIRTYGEGIQAQAEAWLGLWGSNLSLQGTLVTRTRAFRALGEDHQAEIARLSEEAYGGGPSNIEYACQVLSGGISVRDDPVMWYLSQALQDGSPAVSRVASFVCSL
jgi:RHS repeat-associated protein